MQAPDNIQPIALRHDEGEALWFLGGLATIKASSETTGGRVGIIEHLAPKGAGSPLHVHIREDEWFYVIEGELAFCVGGQKIAAPAGSFVYGPRGIRTTVPQGARTGRKRGGRLKLSVARKNRAGQMARFSL